MAGVLAAVGGASSGAPWVGALAGAVIIVAGAGVRQRDRAAAVAAFATYLLGGLAIERYSGGGFRIGWICILALLAVNVRNTWLPARWERSAPETGDRMPAEGISGRLPMLLWPKLRWVFYALAGLLAAALLAALRVPLP